MPVNSRQKGKRGERQWRDLLIEHGFSARRGQQFSGSPDSPDVICEDLPRIHFEVKFTDCLDLRGAMYQAIRDAGRRIPVVAHRATREPWLVTMLDHSFYDYVSLPWSPYPEVSLAQATALQLIERSNHRVSRWAYMELTQSLRPAATLVLKESWPGMPCLLTLKAQAWLGIVRAAQFALS